MGMGTPRLSWIWTTHAPTDLSGAPSASQSLNNGQRENRTWSYPTLRFLIVWGYRKTTAARMAAHRKSDRRRDHLSAGGLRKRALLIASVMRHSITKSC